MTEPQTVLIVDDEPIVRKVLGDLLLSQGYNLAFAANGIEALEQLPNIAPDLILLDISMPGMDGFEVCERLKSDERSQHIPVIMVTALDTTDDIVRGLDAGAEEFISKPVRGLELRARVRSMLRIKGQYDTLEKQRQELETTLHLNRKLSRVFAQHLEALEILHDTGLRLMDNLNMDSVMDLVSETVLELIPEATGCVIHFLSDEEEQLLLPVVFSAENSAKIVHLSVGIEDIVRQAITTKETVYLPNLADAEIEPSPQLSENMKSLLVTPLLENDKPVGTLGVYSAQANIFEKNHTHILSILAHQAAVAIQKARYFRERELVKEQEKWAIRNMFQRYVSPAVVERLVDGREDLALGGKRQDITVLFADIRGFTSFSEKLPPEKVVEALNQYLGLAVEPILAQEGTLDKFMGDAIMALFNAPLPQPDCTMRAVRAALAMQQAITDFNQQNNDGHQLNFGVGIHYGQAVAGNIGTAQQMNYTAIGDTVNLAKRLQENAKGGQILLSHDAYKAVQDLAVAQPIGALSVKGRTATEEVYLVTGLKSDGQEPINLQAVAAQN